jgi:hypothetical protein
VLNLQRGQIDAIKPIYQMREYDDPEQKNSNVLSYKRSMSVSPAPFFPPYITLIPRFRS